jgi:DNA-binding MarR family transcriptional regulator
MFATQKGNVLEALRRNNGATSAELAAYMTVDRYVTARHLPDLERDGRVHKGVIRDCQVTGTPCVTWWMNG